jgi:hypothetical protein
MRVYFAADAESLRQLQDGGPVRLPAFVPASDDELDEFAALADAGEAGDVAIAADVDAADQAVSLEQVASFHVDADGSGDLAWYATQELDQVIALLSAT